MARLDLFTREFVYHGDDGLSQLEARKRQRCPATELKLARDAK